MKTIVNLCIIAYSISSLATFAEDKAGNSAFYYDWQKKLRISSTEPRRFSGTLRAENLNDIEVREIVSATQTVYPGAIVTIDSVKNECPCEDGPSCAAQAWVVSYVPEKVNGLMLSKIENRWKVGPVQKWWLEYNLLQTRRKEIGVDQGGQWWKKYEEIDKSINALIEEFPLCASNES